MFIDLWHSNIAVKAGSRDFEQLANVIYAHTMIFMHTFSGEDSWVIVSYILTTAFTPPRSCRIQPCTCSFLNQATLEL